MMSRKKQTHVVGNGPGKVPRPLWSGGHDLWWWASPMDSIQDTGHRTPFWTPKWVTAICLHASLHAPLVLPSMCSDTKKTPFGQ